MSPFRMLFLLILSDLYLGTPRLWTVTHVYTLTQVGSAITKTLVFHAYYSCAGTIAGSCTHSHTTYSVCFHDGQCICFNPIYCPQEQWLRVQSFTSLLTTHVLMTPTNLCPCEERINRKRWDVLQIGDWKDDEWPPEWIIQVMALGAYINKRKKRFIMLWKKKVMVPLHGQKIALGAMANLYAHLLHSASGSGWNYN
jgi:hypothetical protein